MKKRFQPDWRVHILEEIDPERLRMRGIKGAILDIDNTLVPPHTPVADERAKQFVKRLQDAGLKVCIVSNNIYERAQRFSNSLQIPFVCDGTKPNAGPFYKAMDLLGQAPEHIVVIGDQVFTDVWGGNRMGMMTVLVDPICQDENHFIKWKRRMEKLVVKGYRNE